MIRRELENFGRAPAASRKADRPKDADTRALEQDISEALGLSVTVEDNGGKGEVKIAYRTLEQLDEICRRLSKG
jgi:ParB family chromosome partitioning protein